MFDAISLLVEIIVTLLGVSLAVKKKKAYGWLIALTFGVYVFYDASRFFSFEIDNQTLSFLFLVASFSILGAVWQIYQKAR